MAVKLLLVPSFCCFWTSVGTRTEAPPPQRRTGVQYFYNCLFYADDVLLFVLSGPFSDLSVKDAGPPQTDVPNPARASIKRLRGEFIRCPSALFADNG